MSAKLRKWTVADLGRIAELERLLFGPGAWSQASLAEEARADNRWYVVAEVPDGNVIGYAGLWFGDDATQVMTVAVAPESQRQGVGRKLLAALVDKSILLGAREMFLEVAVDNAPALALYRDFGFLPIAVRKRYYQPGNIDAFSMRLEVY
ncbi:MAG: ribosomal protein S18-alanine N-acetyltransferase, partial [Promicromonosporaceae bacterium]|nr:ribosomal protein S18-alanine N-acetyltransferase [Promicromonosporaceae bacterium]